MKHYYIVISNIGPTFTNTFTNFKAARKHACNMSKTVSCIMSFVYCIYYDASDGDGDAEHIITYKNGKKIAQCN